MNSPLAKLVPCPRLATLTSNGWSRHSARPPVHCLLTLTANEWSRRSARFHVHNLATLMTPTKHLYHTYSTNKKITACHSRRLRCFLSGEARQSRGVGVQPPQWKHTIHTILFQRFDIYCPCSYSHTENTHPVLFYTDPCPNQTERNQTK